MKKTLALLFGFIILLGIGILAFRQWQSAEKNIWICQDGQWVKQGNPQTPMPTGECQEGEKVVEEEKEEEVFDQAGFEKNKQLSQKAVENAPTYQFDGFDLKFDSYEKLTCEDCWEFSFTFSSRQAGYGDRAGQFLAQVITPHTIRVNLEKGEVKSLVTDRTFDELKQQFLK